MKNLIHKLLGSFCIFAVHVFVIVSLIQFIKDKNTLFIIIGISLELFIMSFTMVFVTEEFEIELKDFNPKKILKTVVLILLIIYSIPFFILGYMWEYIQLSFNTGRTSSNDTDKWLTD